MLNALTLDAQYAARILRKNPVFTAVAVAVVALGVGAVSTIFGVANAVVLRPIPGVANPSALVGIERTRGDGGNSRSASYPYYRQIAANSRTMSGIAAWDMVPLTISTGGSGTLVQANLVSGNYFDVLGVRPALGRFFLPDEDRTPNANPVIVLSHEFWKRQFNSDSAILGRAVLVNGRQFTVIGVAAPHFSGLYPVLRTDAWVPMMMQAAVRRGHDLLQSPGNAWLEIVGRTAPGVSRDVAKAELSGLTGQFAATMEQASLPDMAEYTSVRLSTASGLPGDAANAVLGFFVVLLAVSGLVLLIASVNVASMLLARAVARRREIAVRVALGATRARLVRQLLTESVMLFAIGGTAGILLSIYAGQLLARVQLPVDVALAIDVTPDVRVLAVTMAVALLTGVVFGLAPAIHGSRTDLAVTLRGDTAGSGRSRSRLRSTLVGAQVAASLLLLTTSGLFILALARGHRTDPGYDIHDVTTTALDVSLSGYDSTRARAFYTTLRDRVRGLPGVSAVAYSRVLPLSMNNSGYDITVPGYTGRAGGAASSNADLVDEGFFDVLRVPIVAGRALSASDDDHAAGVAVVSEAFAARFWPGRSALGRTFRLDSSSTITVVGVTRNVKFSRLDEKPGPFMYLPIAQHWQPDLNLLVRTSGDPAQIVAPIRGLVHSLDATLPTPKSVTLERASAVTLLPQRFAVIVTAALGLAGLVLAGIGLYGVVAFSTAQRTREIGIRMALGAAAGDVLRMIVAEGMRVVGIGMAVGLVLAMLTSRALRPFLFGVSPLDPMTFITMVAILGAVTAVASYLPARRAALADPVAALREG